VSNKYYKVCQSNVGRRVMVRTAKGKHQGIISRVTRSHLFIRPIGKEIAAEELDGAVKLAEATGNKAKGTQVFFGGGLFGFPFSTILGLGLTGLGGPFTPFTPFSPFTPFRPFTPFSPFARPTPFGPPTPFRPFPYRRRFF
jgi:hypothetical protein